jgi:hypothetical protein
MPLTDKAIRNTKPGAKPLKLFDAAGLYLLVQPAGSKLCGALDAPLDDEGMPTPSACDASAGSASRRPCRVPAQCPPA